MKEWIQIEVAEIKLSYFISIGIVYKNRVKKLPVLISENLSLYMERIKRTKSPSYKTDESSTNHTLIDLRKSNTFCDALILLEDGGCIPVHRVILSATSEYF